MHYYDEVRQEQVIRYKPVDSEHPEYGLMSIYDTEEVPVDPDIEGATKYWQPELVMGGECSHVFRVVNMGLREVECTNPLCRLLTAFHPAVNFREQGGKASIILNYKEYPVLV